MGIVKAVGTLGTNLPPAAGAYQAFLVNGVPNCDTTHTPCNPPPGDWSELPYFGNPFYPPFEGWPAGVPTFADLHRWCGEIRSNNMCFVFSPAFLWQDLSVSAGDILSFRFRTLFGEGADLAFVSFGRATIFELGGVGPITDIDFPLSGLTDPDRATAYSEFSLTFPASGIYTLTFGVFDAIEDPLYNKGLLVDSIKLTSHSVPEPGSLALVALAIAGLGFARRKLH